MNLLVLEPGFRQNWRIGVRVLPQPKKFLIAATCVHGIPCELVGATELQAGQRGQRRVHGDAAMFEELVEFRDGFLAPSQREISQAPEIDRVEGSADLILGQRGGEFVGLSGLKNLDSLGWIVPRELERCVDRGQPVMADNSVKRK